MSRILLVMPSPNNKFNRIPYNLLCLAGYLRERGFEAQICDCQFGEEDHVDFREFPYLGMTTWTGPQIRSALNIAKRYRRENPEGTLIWGGVHPSITPEETASHPLVDYVVRGEGEETLFSLLTALEAGSDPAEVEGVTFVRDGECISTPDRDFIDLDQLPLPPYTLLGNLDRYIDLNRDPSVVSVGTSRGCPFNCGFCYARKVHRNRWRARILLDYYRQGMIDVSILMPSAIYGRGSLGPLRKIVNFINRGIVPVVGNGENLQCLTYVGNVANAAIALAEASKSSGQKYIITDETPYTVNQIVRVAGHESGKHFIMVHLPVFFLRSAATLLDYFSKISNKQMPLSRNSVTAIVQDRIFKIDKIRNELGFHFEFDLVSGIQRTFHGETMQSSAS